jgi:hypothetical protein
MKDLVIIGVLLLLLLLVLLVGMQTEAFTTLRPAVALAEVPISNGEELPLPDDCTQGLYKCVTRRIPFGF